MTADDESHGAAVIDIIEQRMQENAALRKAAQAVLNTWDATHGPSVVTPIMGPEIEALRRALESDNAQS